MSDSTTSVTLLEHLREHPRDPEAWQAFVERYQPRIASWCRRHGLQPADAEDVTQDVLAQLLRAMQRFDYDARGSFRAWLRTVARHAVLAAQQAKRRSLGEANASNALLDDLVNRDDLERELESGFDLELMDMAIVRVRARVAAHTWDAFRLTALEQVPAEEVANQLEMPVARIYVARHRVQKLLQEEIQRLDPESSQPN